MGCSGDGAKSVLDSSPEQDQQQLADSDTTV